MSDVLDDFPANSRRPRILAVDDDSDVLSFIQSVLELKFDVHAVAASVHLEDEIDRFAPDVLLMDYWMPERDGFSTCRDLRANTKYDNLPIVFLSGINSEQARLDSYAAGGDDFVTKPFEAAELLAKLDVWARLGQRTAELVSRSRHFKELALKDHLTGLLSRRHILEVLDNELARFKRYRQPFSLMLIDLDLFKHINDEYGHAAGDAALKAAAAFLTKHLRENDVIARYGGDEFLVLLPGTGSSEIKTVCRKLSSQTLRCALRDDVTQNISFSIGATVADSNVISATSLIDSADMAMLTAKKAGKGRFFISQRDTNSYELLDELRAKRESTREAMSRIISGVIEEMYRETDIIGGRVDSILVLGAQLAERLELSLRQRLTLGNATRLLPCLQIGVPLEIQRDPNAASDEWEASLRVVFERNIDLLREGNLLHEEADVLAAVRERFDGKGFPHGLEGDDISLLSRVLTLLSAFVNLHESGLPSHDEDINSLRQAMREEAGTRFDPVLVDILEEILEGHASSEQVKRGAILLVDDNSLFRQVLARKLDHEGYEVIEARSAKEARVRFPDRDWHAILMDMRLENMGSGLDLLADLKQVARNPVPAVFVSARQERQAIQSAREAGARGYVLKPFPMDRMLRFLETLHHPHAEAFQVISW